MFNNPAMQVFATEGYYDNSTNFAKLHWDLSTMQLPANLQANVTELYTEAGHMSYSDDIARALIRKDIGPFYDKSLTPAIMAKISAMKKASAATFNEKLP
jgi:carboxypeptidase C (cathepsin A)